MSGTNESNQVEDKPVEPFDTSDTDLRTHLSKAYDEEFSGDDNDEDDGAGFLDTPLPDADVGKKISPEDARDVASRKRTKDAAGSGNAVIKTDDDTAGSETDEAKSESPKENQAAEQGKKEAGGASKEGEGDSGEGEGDSKPRTFQSVYESLTDDDKKLIDEKTAPANQVSALFAGFKDSLGKWADSPVEALGAVLEINRYAQENPTDYMGWFATQVAQAGGKDMGTMDVEGRAEIFVKAAAQLGVDLIVKPPENTPNEDPFEDEETKALRQQLAEAQRLLAQNQVKMPAGPDLQRVGAQQQLHSLISSVDDTGAPKYPHFEKVEGHIRQILHERVTTNPGVAIGFDKFDEIYRQALLRHPETMNEEIARIAAARAANDAAEQNQPGSASPKPTTGKLVDPSGGGAVPRPRAGQSNEGRRLSVREILEQVTKDAEI